MSPSDCERRRGDLAMAAAGRLSDLEAGRLETHLSSCPQCERELEQLRTVARALELVPPAALAAAWPPGTGKGSALGVPPPLRAGSPRSLRRRRAVGGIMAAAAFASAALFWFSSAARPGLAVSLHGTRSVQASAVLTREQWGTDLALQVAGQPPGRLYQVSMESKSGTWWQVGSYRSESSPSHVQLACAVAPSQVERIWVENSAGRVVLRAYLG
ncbi:MAG TPA: hypothetical protein VNH20_08820 [Candidatus Dormibacteraeota bacterium]|nr:hypothetical protein [Candidatus Dormibacteraeota bacterium]